MPGASTASTRTGSSLWGSSFSGGHVLRTAARDGRVAAVISQVPHTDGIATLRELHPVQAAKLTWAGIRDRARGAGGAARALHADGRPSRRVCRDDER